MLHHDEPRRIVRACHQKVFTCKISSDILWFTQRNYVLACRTWNERRSKENVRRGLSWTTWSPTLSTKTVRVYPPYVRCNNINQIHQKIPKMLSRFELFLFAINKQNNVDWNQSSFTHLSHTHSKKNACSLHNLYQWTLTYLKSCPCLPKTIQAERIFSTQNFVCPLSHLQIRHNLFSLWKGKALRMLATQTAPHIDPKQRISL